MLLGLLGCGPSSGVDPVAAAEVRAGDAAVRLVGEREADLLLYVSNQSFEDPQVHLSVMVDGVRVVDGDFHVEGQHNWVAFPLAMPPGGHQVTATSDSGAALGERFSVPGDEPRYAVLDHWGAGAGADLTWSFHRRPVAFA